LHPWRPPSSPVWVLDLPYFRQSTRSTPSVDKNPDRLGLHWGLWASGSSWSSFAVRSRPNIDARFRAATAVWGTCVFHFRPLPSEPTFGPTSPKKSKAAGADLRGFPPLHFPLLSGSVGGSCHEHYVDSRYDRASHHLFPVVAGRCGSLVYGHHSAWDYFARISPPPRSAGYAQTPIVVDHDTRTLTSISPPDYACRKPLPQSLAPRKAISSDDKFNFQPNLCEWR
jgi:hypothetical protein